MGLCPLIAALSPVTVPDDEEYGVSQSGEGPAAPLLGRHRAAGGYRRVVGAHRAPGFAAHGRGYLFTVALLAGTASMPILAAVSAGSATVGSTALPDSSTPFIPTPSVGPVVVPLPVTGRPAVIPSTRPGMVVAPSTGPSAPGLAPRAPAPPADPDRSGPDAIRHPPPPAPIPRRPPGRPRRLLTEPDPGTAPDAGAVTDRPADAGSDAHGDALRLDAGPFPTGRHRALDQFGADRFGADREQPRRDR